MIKEAENIILNKEYFELSEEELATVSELVQNAEEYEEMKWFLASTQQALVSDKIEASPDLKRRVMEHLEQPKEDRKFWLNGVVVFLFPEDKKFYQKPAFQMSLAALLIIGFLMVYDRPFQENDMAINDSEQILPTIEELDEKEEISSGEAEAPENEFTTITIEDSKLTGEDIKELDKEVLLEQPVFAMDVDAEPMDDLADEVEELPQDGFYQGPIEEAEVSNDDQTVLDNSRTNNKNEGGGAVTAPGVISNNNATTGGSVGGNQPSGYTETTALKDNRDKSSEGNKKVKSKSSTDTDRFLAKRNETRTVATQDANNADLDAVIANEDVPEAGLSVQDSEEKKGELKEQQQEKIRPYELHVNETKELKSLFGTYK